VEGLSRFKVLPVNDLSSVGGFAVQDQVTSRWSGRQLRLDKVGAEILKFELERAFELGRKEAVNA
jgi:hypothetical protein